MSQVKIPKHQFYVYTLAYPDGRVFYVGKGSGYRINQHEIVARNGDQSIRSCVIREIWQNGGEVLKAIVYTSPSEEKTLEEERRLILAHESEYLVNASLKPGLLSSTGQPTAPISFRLSETARTILAHYAREEGISQSELLDRAIKEFAPAILAEYAEIEEQCRQWREAGEI